MTGAQHIHGETMPRLIESLANGLLSVDEIAVANRIELLIDHRKIKKAQSLIQELLEVGFEYVCEKEDLLYFKKRK